MKSIVKIICESFGMVKDGLERLLLLFPMPIGRV
jgi:hypothetical protein